MIAISLFNECIWEESWLHSAKSSTYRMITLKQVVRFIWNFAYMLLLSVAMVWSKSFQVLDNIFGNMLLLEYYYRCWAHFFVSNSWIIVPTFISLVWPTLLMRRVYCLRNFTWIRWNRPSVSYNPQKRSTFCQVIIFFDRIELWISNLGLRAVDILTYLRDTHWSLLKTTPRLLKSK